MERTHIPVDSKHLALCGVCTCSKKDLRFAESRKDPTCPECLKVRREFRSKKEGKP